MGVVRARGGVGTHWQPFNLYSQNTSGNASQVWVGGEGAGGGVGTHWQPLNTLKTPRKCKPGVGSGEAGVGWGVGGEGAGGCGQALAAFKYSQNT